jgi:small subunit ribosomal protein S20
MANHKSAIKRIRNSAAKRIRNRYYGKTTRNAVRDLRNTTDKKSALEMFPKVASMVDKLAKKNIIHKKKAANVKSKLAVYINKLA